MIDRSEQLPPGTMVGGFRIERLLGEGSSGAVYEGFDARIEKRAAIKVLAGRLAGDTAALERLGREGRAANRVGEGAVEVLALGALDDGRPYLVMPLLEGRSLRAELEEAGALPAPRAWAIARQVAEILERAHAAGIVHRDLKPENIFLERAAGRPERVRVLDFGLAKLLGGGPAATARLTQSGTAVGTPAYMAPEQWFNAAIGPATDQYALGAVLYELLAGGPPFRADRLQALLEDHLHRAPPPLGPGLPSGAEPLLQRALAKSAGERFASMRLFIEAGDEAFADRGRLAAAAAAGPEVAAPSAPGWRRLAVHAAILLGGLAALLLVGYTGPGRRDPLHWFCIAGYQAYLGLALLAVAAVVLPLAARRRSGPGALGWTVCLLPAVSGALGTYSGWMATIAHVEQAPTTSRFATASLGMYEANASRFMGFAVAAVLCLALAAWLREGSPSAAGARARDRIAGLALLALLAVSAAVAGVPSGALISGAGALALLVLLASRGGAELERGLALLLSLLFAAGAGFARIEAREGYLWDADALPTRVARAAEITAAAGERLATTLIALAAVAVLLAVEGRRLASLARAAPRRPGRAALVLLLLLVAAVVTDAALYARMLRVRNRYRDALASQFALLGRLEPPIATGLPAERFRPSDAPALQITRQVVAVNAEPLARLDAVELSGRLRRQLTEVLARDAVSSTSHAAGRPDLLVTVDREVAFGTVSRILHVAFEAGVRRIELLLARSGPPPLSSRSPAEAEHLLPSDFVAIRAELGESGVEATAAEPFDSVAARLLAAVRAAPGGAALRLPARER